MDDICEVVRKPEKQASANEAATRRLLKPHGPDFPLHRSDCRFKAKRLLLNGWEDCTS